MGWLAHLVIPCVFNTMVRVEYQFRIQSTFVSLNWYRHLNIEPKSFLKSFVNV